MPELLGPPGRENPPEGEVAQGQALLREEKKEGRKGRDRDLMALLPRLWIQAALGFCQVCEQKALPWSHFQEEVSSITRQSPMPMLNLPHQIPPFLASSPQTTARGTQCPSAPEPGPPSRTHGASQQQSSLLGPGPPAISSPSLHIPPLPRLPSFPKAACPKWTVFQTRSSESDLWVAGWL